MPSWHAATATVTGPKHRDAGRDGQDASAMRPMAGGHVIAIADGHGSERCYRADRGARLAVTSALAVLLRAAQSGATSLHAAVEMIPGELVGAWRDEVMADRDRHPIGAFDHDLPEDDDDSFTAYGTTLLAAMARGDELLIVHLGDGESLLASTDGTPRRPFIRDPLLAADMTTSLALPDAERHVRTRAFDCSVERIDLVVLATDGYANAFADDAAFDQVGPDLLRGLGARDPGWVAGELPAWLEHSAGVSGDDASLGLLYRWPLPTQP
jgi:serine/threonine protein phosphatase PrpC